MSFNYTAHFFSLYQTLKNSMRESTRQLSPLYNEWVPASGCPRRIKCANIQYSCFRTVYPGRPLLKSSVDPSPDRDEYEAIPVESSWLPVKDDCESDMAFETIIVVVCTQRLDPRKTCPSSASKSPFGLKKKRETFVMKPTKLKRLNDTNRQYLLRFSGFFVLRASTFEYAHEIEMPHAREDKRYLSRNPSSSR